MVNNPEEKKKFTGKVNRILARTFPDARIELTFSNPLELLIATILSAQCTDQRVNELTKPLFKKYKTPQDYLKVPDKELEEDIRPAGFFRNKTRSIRACCQGLIEDFNETVPDTMEELVTLGGVGRKTANVVLGNAFGKPAIMVDTHVIRVSGRLELTQNTDPTKIEFDLQKLLPPKEWTEFSHRMILLGRHICKARTPLCEACPLNSLCSYYHTLQSR